MQIHLGKIAADKISDSKTEGLFVPAVTTKKYPNTPPPNATDVIQLDRGFIPFTEKFKYLGSWIVQSLSDEYDINMRIAATSSAMYSLKPYFKNKDVSLQAKRLIFLSIPFHIFLWRSNLGR